MSKKSKAAKITKITAQSRPSQHASGSAAKPEAAKASTAQASKSTTSLAANLNTGVVTDRDEIKNNNRGTAQNADRNKTEKADHNETTQVDSAAIKNDSSNKSQNTDLKTNPKAKTKEAKKSQKSADSAEKPLKEVFILARPFVALGRYLRDSWRELRQVRWPNRKSTWKMTLAVLTYCAVFILLVTLLDIFFTFIFKLVLGQ